MVRANHDSAIRGGAFTGAASLFWGRNYSDPCRSYYCAYSAYTSEALDCMKTIAVDARALFTRATSGKKLARIPPYSMGAKVFGDDVIAYSHDTHPLPTAIKDWPTKTGYRINFSNKAVPEYQEDKRRVLVPVLERFPDAQTFALVVLHELSHGVDHDINNRAGLWAAQPMVDRFFSAIMGPGGAPTAQDSIAESVAEASAYLLAQRFGFITDRDSSAAYIASFMSHHPEHIETAITDTISTATELLARLTTPTGV